MTRDKDLKRRVRARMLKTGESYTAARAHLLGTPHPPIPDNCAELAGMADETVAEKTGRTWAEWVRVLDDIGATEMEHRDIARWVKEQTGLSWWTQTVTVGYERIRGLREIGQRRSGEWEANKSRTIGVSAEAAFRAIADDGLRRRWLDAPLTVRGTNPPKGVRITWGDGTDVQAYVTPKGDAKCSVAIQHGKLESKEASDEAKAAWDERLGRLKEMLEG